MDFKEWKKSHNLKGSFFSGVSPVPSVNTYNTKVKLYPDGTKNIQYAPTDLYGRFEHNKYYKQQNKSLLQIYFDIQKEKNKILDIQLHHSEIEKQIEVFYKSVDNYLLCCKQCREYDTQQNIDSFIWSGITLDFKEKKFLDSITTNIRHDNLKRAKDSIFDLVYSNTWDWFFTGTIDPKRIDSSDPAVLKKPLQKWLNNMVDRYGISYVLIFERHKKTNGIHIHGMIKENPFTPLRLVPSDTKTFYGFKKPMKQRTAQKHGLDWNKGKTVYNLKTWRFGWSTAIKVYGDRGALSHYITKYITKENEKIMGRYYWHSRDLEKPKIQYMNVNYDEIHLPIFHGWKFDLQLSDENKRELKKLDYTEWEDITY